MIKAGVLGAGHLGKIHLRLLQQSNAYELIGFYDPDQTTALKVQEEFGSFSKYIWGFVDGKPIKNAFTKMEDVPAKTELSDKISKDLKKRGFKFVGSTVIYAFMQATGMVNDHITSCFRYAEV